YNASIIMQELRKPLHNINLSAEMLRTVIPGGDAEIYVDVILRNAARIDNILNTFFVFSHSNQVPSASNCSLVARCGKLSPLTLICYLKAYTQKETME
ncbi:MAG TPA: histidine kinase dimerization/phospho-acceptor domain-containing protein, partial [Flavobacterium sp.]|nr:histidine kinase dimerization/phospho-acceptor domain-containing protein [Flavobacterium sp.]